MTGIFIKDQDGTAEIITSNYYGADFKANVFDQSTSTYLLQNISMQELIEPVSAYSSASANNQIQGDTDIEVNDITGLQVSDRIKIQNYIYSVSNIIGNNVTISKGLLENLTAGATISRVGNLGIYKVELNMNSLGEFTLIGKDGIFGLNVTKMIKVVPKSLETMYRDVKNLEYAILGS